jgi:glycogen debranching enzyme
MSRRQPFLHELLVCVQAPQLILCGRDGQLAADGVNGIYLADRRIVSRSVISLSGSALTPIGSQLIGAGETRSIAAARDLGDDGDDPTVILQRTRSLSGSAISETIAVSTHAREEVSTEVTLWLASDLADIATVKAGMAGPPLTPQAGGDGLSWTATDGTTVSAVAKPRPDRIDATSGMLLWSVRLSRGEQATITVRYAVADDPTPQIALGVETSALSMPVISAPDGRLGRFVEQSVADLRGLEMADASAPGDHFLAAGAPWYLTLFGRDSLIAARMALPLGTGIAAGTLRALARRQGTKVDDDSAEEPGKILHELRRSATDHGDGSRAGHALVLPPVYYGTVDATALWVMLLHDAWRWGMPTDDVRALLPTMQRALVWMREYGTGEHGFISYLDKSGHGLANQGWKDSGDAVQFRGGQLAEAPLALSEVQAYAHAAAVNGATLLEAFGLDGADEWRNWAATLAQAFRSSFWVSDPDGDYPAIALDARGVAVDAVASNVGHLLGTGLLNSDEAALVVARLSSTELSSGFGLRTMASTAAGFNSLSYHCGSVWTHDTAIAITGLGSADRDGVPGAAAAATDLIAGLLRVADEFEYRMPELHSGQAHSPGLRAIAYPASCRPQAWSAASAIAIVSTVLGLAPDAPNRALTVRPIRPYPVGSFGIEGLRLAGENFSVRLPADASSPTVAAPVGFSVLTQ